MYSLDAQAFLYSPDNIHLTAVLSTPLNPSRRYLSNLIFELWQLPNGEHVVRVMYNLHDLHLSACPPGKLPTVKQFASQVCGSVEVCVAACGWGFYLHHAHLKHPCV